MNCDNGGEEDDTGYEYVAPGLIEGEPGRKDSGVPRHHHHQHDKRSRHPAAAPPVGDTIHEHEAERHGVCLANPGGKESKQANVKKLASRKDAA